MAVVLTAIAGLALMTGCSSVVARVNGSNVTRKDFYEELERTHGLQVLQTTILRRLLLQRAEAAGVMPSAEDVKKRFGEFRKERFNDDEQEMRKWMKANSVDDVVLQDQFKYDLATFNLRTRHLKPTEEQLKTFFNEYKERYFDKPARVTFRQIVVPNKQAADKVIAELNSEGERFAEIAREISMDPGSKENGGLYEDVPWEILKAQAPAIHDALRKLEPNQFSQQPVHYKEGFFVIKLVEAKPAEPARFEDPAMKEQVKQAYLQENATSEQDLMAELVKGADVVVLDERYKAGIEPFFAAGGQSALPPGVEKQLQEPTQLAPPTQIDEQAAPKPVNPVGGATP